MYHIPANTGTAANTSEHVPISPAALLESKHGSCLFIRRQCKALQRSVQSEAPWDYVHRTCKLLVPLPGPNPPAKTVTLAFRC